MPISISIIGACGRMGKKIIQLVIKSTDFILAGGSCRPGSQDIGKDLGELAGEKAIGLYATADKDALFKNGDVVIDFSSPFALKENLECALRFQKPFVIGTTGHDDENLKAIEAAAKEIPIFFSSNFSTGMALCTRAVAAFAEALKDQCHIDIIETHHAQKKDSPSGTALNLAKASAYALAGLDSNRQAAPPPGTLSIHSLREGNAMGIHEIIFHCEGEKITLKHEALSRDVFALGALKAAKYIFSQSSGIFLGFA